MGTVAPELPEAAFFFLSPLLLLPLGRPGDLAGVVAVALIGVALAFLPLLLLLLLAAALLLELLAGEAAEAACGAFLAGDEASGSPWQVEQ